MQEQSEQGDPLTDRAGVFKVGGSLFDWPGLLDALEQLLLLADRPLLVAGGGAAADVVRNWDAIHCLGEERAHRLAVKSLELSEAFLADSLKNAVVVTDRWQAETAWGRGQIPILRAGAFLKAIAPKGAAPLPQRWDVTSDSIAAWIAARWPADLTLLKSTSPIEAKEPYVDPYFTRAACGVRHVRWWNLRQGVGGPLSLQEPLEPPTADANMIVGRAADR